MVEEVLKNRIRELRKARNITQAAFASAIGVSESTISKWESWNAIPDIEIALLNLLLLRNDTKATSVTFSKTC